ncbi:MAG: LuxR C-terminal-related transcriptional regulator [Verrucomicrobiaceae bacterium]|nr:LuxR C-terminal-related transcriptional regulator [Verrucomicrobiaceae bacterium]
MEETGENGSAHLIGKQERYRVGNPFLIGRARGNDLRLKEADISRRHAMIFQCGGHWWVTDVGSRNGVLVNGVRVRHPRALGDEDQIRVGVHTFTFSTTDSPRSTVAGRDPMTEAAVADALPSPGSVIGELVVVSPDGSILEGEKAALRFFGAALEHVRFATRTRLPAAVRQWLTALCTGRLPVNAPLEMVDGGRCLVVTLCWRDDDAERCYLLLREDSALAAIERIRTLGLTRREAEVMFWICQGKKNAEIGEILEVSLHTVNRHVEHIFKKLGVGSRQQAVAWVLERRVT